MNTSYLTYAQIKEQLRSLAIDIASHKDDDEYDISEAIAEQEELEQALVDGNYLDFEEE